MANLSDFVGFAMTVTLRYYSSKNKDSQFEYLNDAYIIISMPMFATYT